MVIAAKIAVEVFKSKAVLLVVVTLISLPVTADTIVVVIAAHNAWPKVPIVVTAPESEVGTEIMLLASATLASLIEKGGIVIKFVVDNSLIKKATTALLVPPAATTGMVAIEAVAVTKMLVVVALLAAALATTVYGTTMLVAG